MKNLAGLIVLTLSLVLFSTCTALAQADVILTEGVTVSPVFEGDDYIMTSGDHPANLIVEFEIQNIGNEAITFDQITVTIRNMAGVDLFDLDLITNQNLDSNERINYSSFGNIISAGTYRAYAKGYAFDNWYYFPVGAMGTENGIEFNVYNGAYIQVLDDIDNQQVIEALTFNDAIINHNQFNQLIIYNHQNGDLHSELDLEILNEENQPDRSQFDFQYNNDEEFTLLSNSARSIEIIFHPATEGFHQATLRITGSNFGHWHNDDFIDITLSGTGLLAPELQNIDTSPAILVFPQVMINEGIADEQISIINNGPPGTELVIDNAAIENNNAVFTIIAVDGPNGENDYPVTLLGSEDNEELILTVRFQPNLAGVQNDRILISCNDRDLEDQTYEVNIIGTGRAPAANVDIIEELLDFETVSVGSYEDRSFVIENNTPGEIYVESILVVGANEDYFDVWYPEQQDFPLRMMSGGDRTVRVEFGPGSEGVFDPVIEITCRGLENTPAILPVLGRGVLPHLFIDPENRILNFGDVPVQNESRQTILFRNDGEAELYVSVFDMSDWIHFYPDPDVSAHLDFGETHSVDIVFTPTEEREYIESFTFETDDPENEDVMITLLANGIMEMGQIHGNITVIDAETAIENALVIFSGIEVVETHSNENGFYYIEELTPGNYSVEISAFAYETLFIPEIEVFAGDVEFDFQLQPIAVPEGNLTGNLVNLEGTVLLEWDYQPNNDFIGFNIYRNEILIGSTTENSYEDQLDEPGTYEYLITASYTAGELQISTPITILWEEVANGTVQGLITNSVLNQAIVGAIISFGEWQAFSNELGIYRIENIPAGFYEVIVEAENFNTFSNANLEVVAGEQDFDFSLLPIVQETNYYVGVPDTGIPYGIVVNEAQLDNQLLSINDEIGVFDGELCVGASLVNGEWPLTIITWAGDPEHGLDGFVAGNIIHYRFFSNEREEEFPAEAEYVGIRGDGTFGHGAYSEVILRSNIYQHFEPVIPNLSPYHIQVNNALLDYEVLSQGDEIGVFDGELCVGAGIVNGTWPLSFNVWEADIENDLQGFTEGNPILYKLWNNNVNEEYYPEAEYIDLNGNGTFGYGDFSEVILTAYTGLQMNLPLSADYFELISMYLIPPSLDAVELFGNIDHLAVVYQNDGGIYVPGVINNLINIRLTEGYRLFCDQNSAFSMEGVAIDPDIEYTVYPNRWNWLGYPYAEPVPVTIALEEISDNIIVIMSDNGRLWIPEAVNTMGNMIPGEGYLTFVSEEVTFTYNNALLSHPLSEETRIPEIEGSPVPTGLPYAVLVNLTDELQCSGAKVIDIYDGNLLVGKSLVLEGGTTPVITWGGNAEYGLAGFTEGHKIGIKVLNESGNLIAAVVEGEFGEDAYSSVTLDVNPVPSEFTVETGYPNPFNPSTIVPFVVPTAGEVIFTVYNLLGQEIFNNREVLKAGKHNFAFDASRADIELVSGIYFIQIQYEGSVNTQKVMYLK